MKPSFSSHRRPARKVRSSTALHLEVLEERTLLDGKSQALFNPQAILGISHGVSSPRQEPPVSIGGQAGPTQARYPNILVNNPTEDGNSPRDTHSETTIAVVGTTVLSSYNDSFNASLNPAKYTGFSRSTDRGQTFTDGGSLPNNPNGDAGDPVLGHDNQTGRTYLATLSFGAPLEVWRSDDNLVTFQQPVNAAPGRSGLDKEWLAVDNFSGAGRGNVYVVLRDFGSGNGIYLTRSTDQGATFGPNGGVLIAGAGNGNVQGAWVAVGPDHAVYASYYQSDDIGGTNGRIMIRKSTDQGVTFGAPIMITRLTTVGINGDLHIGGFRSNAFTQVVVNPVNGQLYAAYDDKGTGSDRADVFFRQSNDGGAIWSNAVRVVDDTTGRDQWQPALAVTPSGSKVGVFWYDRRLDTANNLIDRYGAIGVVSGSSVVFGSNFRISDTSFAPEFGHDPAINGVYMGDYDQAVADTGSFYLTWGDNRSNSLGHAGHRADVRFARIPVDVTGPSVIAVTPFGNVLPPVSTLRVTFDEEIDPTTATVDQFAIQDPNGNPINVQSVTPVAGSNNMQFDVVIDTQIATGSYAVTIGPFIADTLGHNMDQDGDGDSGSDAEDQFNGTFGIQGPRVIASTPTGNASLPGTIDHVRFTFSESMDPTTFTTDQVVSFTDPQGNDIPINDIQPVDGSNNTQFDVSFDPLPLAGTYHMVIGPNILDTFGNPMDQNGNLIGGEVPDDEYTAQFAVASPTVTALARNGRFQDPVSSVRVTFNEPIDPSTFTPDQISNLTDPQGHPITVTGVAPVDNSDTQFDVSFDPQGTFGSYRITVAAGGIADLFGNPVTTPFSGTFVVATVYSAFATDYEVLDIHGLPGTFRVIQYADDLSLPVNLGSHSFNFFGRTYTGNNQLFASSNALISFGSADAAFGNTDLTSSPPEAVIAPLWSDWIKNSGTDMLEGYIDEANDRLVLQWNEIQHFSSSPRGITFQAILALDTGGAPGDIVINYVTTDTGDQNADGATSTVGVKNTGSQGIERTLVSFNHTNSLIGAQKAILLTTNSGAPGAPGRGHSSNHGAIHHLTPLATTLTAPVGLGVALGEELPLATPLAISIQGMDPLMSKPTEATHPIDQVFADVASHATDAGSHFRPMQTETRIDPLGLDHLGDDGLSLS